mgnify:CR=1 FL=1
MQNMIAHAGFQTAEAKSVEKVATVDCDGPSAVSNNFTGAGSVGFPSNVMIACTWNKDLAHTYGYDMENGYRTWLLWMVCTIYEPS